MFQKSLTEGRFVVYNFQTELKRSFAESVSLEDSYKDIMDFLQAFCDARMKTLEGDCFNHYKISVKEEDKSTLVCKILFCLCHETGS